MLFISAAPRRPVWTVTQALTRSSHQHQARLSFVRRHADQAYKDSIAFRLWDERAVVLALAYLERRFSGVHACVLGSAEFDLRHRPLPASATMFVAMWCADGAHWQAIAARRGEGRLRVWDPIGKDWAWDNTHKARVADAVARLPRLVEAAWSWFCARDRDGAGAGAAGAATPSAPVVHDRSVYSHMQSRHSAKFALCSVEWFLRGFTHPTTVPASKEDRAFCVETHDLDDIKPTWCLDVSLEMVLDLRFNRMQQTGQLGPYVPFIPSMPEHRPAHFTSSWLISGVSS